MIELKRYSDIYKQEWNNFLKFSKIDTFYLIEILWITMQIVLMIFYF